MICIKCSADTKVINSRPHKKTPSVWRRRQCTACGTIFTTSEVVADVAYLFQVVSPAGKASFSLPRLMLSIVPCLEHRVGAQVADESYWLTQTVAQSIQATATDSIDVIAIAEETYNVLSHFDATAGITYGARHGLIRNSSQKPKRGRPRTSRRGIN